MNSNILRKVIVLCLIGSLFAQLVQAQVEEIRNRFLHSKALMVAAHRAVHQQYPENSLPAIQDAIDLGVDIVELDIRVTADGIPVILHDQTVDRTSTGQGDIEQLGFSDVQGFYLLDEGEVTDLKIPTLKEALVVCKGKIMVDMDMKTGQIEAVLAVVKSVGVSDQLIFFDSDWEVLKEIKSQLPNAFLMPRTHKTKDIKKAVRQLDPEAVHIDPSFYTAKTVKRAEKYGLRVWINSLGDRDERIRSNPNAESQKEWLVLGANIVQTDCPAFWVVLRND